MAVLKDSSMPYKEPEPLKIPTNLSQELLDILAEETRYWSETKRKLWKLAVKNSEKPKKKVKPNNVTRTLKIHG